MVAFRFVAVEMAFTARHTLPDLLKLSYSSENYLPSRVSIQLTWLVHPNGFSHRLLLLIMLPIKIEFEAFSLLHGNEQKVPLVVNYRWLLVVYSVQQHMSGCFKQRALWWMLMRDSWHPRISDQTLKVNHYIYSLPFTGWKPQQSKPGL